MTIEKTIAGLRKLHESYAEDVRLLTEKLERVKNALVDATNLASQTAEAILALEGKSSPLRDMIAQAMAPGTALTISETPPTSETVTDELPPPEPGFKWAKNEVGQDVLIPLFVPETFKQPETSSFTLPVIDEEDTFTDKPEDFLDVPTS